MKKLPIFYGYAGIIPFFIIAMAMLLGDTGGNNLKAGAILQVAYAAMILSFLGGAHWGQAIPRNHQKQITFSMLPTIASFCLFVLAVFGMEFTALIGTAAMFYAVYVADQKMMPREFIPPGYFKFRRNLTYIVMALLLISAVTVF